MSLKKSSNNKINDTILSKINKVEVEATSLANYNTSGLKNNIPIKIFCLLCVPIINYLPIVFDNNF